MRGSRGAGVGRGCLEIEVIRLIGGLDIKFRICDLPSCNDQYLHVPVYNWVDHLYIIRKVVVFVYIILLLDSIYCRMGISTGVLFFGLLPASLSS